MNFKTIFFTVALILIGVTVYALATKDIAKPAKPEAKIAAANNAIATAAGQARQPVNTPPAAIQAAAPATTQPQAAASGNTTGTSDLSPEDMAKIQQEVKETVETKFKNVLSFPLDEQKMITYARASLKVKRINTKWDVQIAGADKDTTAIEYNNLAVEEITKSLQSMSGLTLDQYNEITKLTATDAEFNNIYQVYKQLIEDGVIAPVAPPTPAVSPAPAAGTAAPVAATAPVATALQPAAAVKPVAAPVNPGIAPVPPGSPKPPYSQPVSR
jgi:hypothetical protein